MVRETRRTAPGGLLIGPREPQPDPRSYDDRQEPNTRVMCADCGMVMHARAIATSRWDGWQCSFCRAKV